MLKPIKQMMPWPSNTSRNRLMQKIKPHMIKQRKNGKKNTVHLEEEEAWEDGCAFLGCQR